MKMKQPDFWRSIELHRPKSHNINLLLFKFKDVFSEEARYVSVILPDLKHQLSSSRNSAQNLRGFVDKNSKDIQLSKEHVLALMPTLRKNTDSGVSTLEKMQTKPYINLRSYEFPTLEDFIRRKNKLFKRDHRDSNILNYCIVLYR